MAGGERARRESHMQPIGAPASTSRQAVYNPPCVDLWDTVYPTELMVCSMFIQCVCPVARDTGPAF